MRHAYLGTITRSHTPVYNTCGLLRIASLLELAGKESNCVDLLCAIISGKGSISSAKLVYFHTVTQFSELIQ